MYRKKIWIMSLIGKSGISRQVYPGMPVHIRSDNGAEFTAKNVRSWLAKIQIKPLFIEPDGPWENGYIESFNGKKRDELMNGENFYTLKGARVLIEMWRKEYNNIRPHSSLGYRPQVTEAILVPTTKFQQFVLT